MRRCFYKATSSTVFSSFHLALLKKIMATLDLNQEPDVEDVEVLPDLNEALVGDDHFDDAHGGDENQNFN